MLCLRWCTDFSLATLVTRERGLLSSCSVWAFSLQWFLLLQSRDSRAHGLQQLRHVGSVVVVPRLSGFAACGIFLDQSQTVSLALASGSFTTEPRGKPLCCFLNWVIALTSFSRFPACKWKIQVSASKSHYME